MRIIKGLYHAAIISLLYMSYRYMGDMVNFILSMFLTTLFIRRLYLLEKSS